MIYHVGYELKVIRTNGLIESCFMFDGFLLQEENERARHCFVMIPHYLSIQLQRRENHLMASHHISPAPPIVRPAGTPVTATMAIQSEVC